MISTIRLVVLLYLLVCQRLTPLVVMVEKVMVRLLDRCTVIKSQ